VNYELILDEEAIRFLEKQQEKIKKRIFLKLQEAKKNPHHFFERLEGRTDYKLRIGNYRAITDITEEKIIITCIGRRKNIYKKS
jgi:mRNA interferase RelE/StbE